MEFAYTARDSFGKLRSGTVEARDPNAATQLLERDGYSVLDLDAATSESPVLLQRIRRADIVYFTSQLAVMLDTGIGLDSALESIADQETNVRLKTILDDLRQQVSAGEPFSQALARHGRYFDHTYVALMKAAEQSGRMPEMLERVARYLQAELETRAKVRAALAYPAIMAFLAVGVTIFLLVVIMPKFTPLFQRRGVSLPKITTALITVSSALTTYWYYWIAGTAAAIYGAVRGAKTESGRQLLDRVKLRLPIVGNVVRKTTLSRSIRTLGTMLESGVPVLDAVQLSGLVSHNCHFQQVWDNVSDEITQGGRIADVLQESPLFPPTLVQMVRSGEETGKLDRVLHKVSEFYDREVETTVKAATSLIEPILICAMGVVVGTIGLSILLPIFSLSRMPG